MTGYIRMALVLASFGVQPALAAKGTLIHEFKNNSFGSNPIVTGPDGTIYGSTQDGGSGCNGGCGTIYKLTPPGSGGGGWSYTRLYTFHDGQDGAFPSSALTLGPDGTLYGTSSSSGGDPVFSLAPPAGGQGAWVFTVLARFPAKTYPNPAGSSLIYSAGALYGITAGGAKACPYTGCGSVFRVSQDQGGQWALTTLVAFGGKHLGGSPVSIAGPDMSGGFYVANSYRGRIVYVAPDGSGAKARVVDRTGKRSPGCLVLAASGTLYGVASGPVGGGDFFQVVPKVGGWTTTDLLRVSDHRFVPCPDIAGPDGSLLGTVFGDQDAFPGDVFQLTPPAGQGSWTYHDLFRVGHTGRYGPLNVVFGLGGNLYAPVSQAYGPPPAIFEIRYGGSGVRDTED